MDVYFGIIALAALIGFVAMIWVARRNRWRFGKIVTRGAVERGAGPYRGGVVPELEDRPVPRALFLAAATSIIWGIATLFVFVPAGALLCLMLFDAGFPGPLGGSVLLVICFGGLALAIALFVKAAQLFARDPAGLGGLVVLSRWHHGAVFAFFMLASIVVGEPGLVLATFVVVGAASGLGAFQTVLLDRARLRLLELASEELAPPENFHVPSQPSAPLDAMEGAPAAPA